MFKRTTIGLEISAEGLRMVQLGGTRAQPVIEGLREASFPAGTMKISLREPNVLQPAPFVAAVRDTHAMLLTKVVRTAVALPDATGRVMLIELDTRFKSRNEAADIIRWKLKKNFPFDINEAHLDFQELQVRDAGEVTVLVSLLSRQVLLQYEELLVSAGLEPNQIDFTNFRLYELFSHRLMIEEDFAFICFYAGVISLLIFRGGTLVFYRAKEIPGNSFSPNRIYREVSSSLLVYRDKNPHLPVGKVFCYAAAANSESLRSVVAEALGQEPVLLDLERIVGKVQGLSPGRENLFAMSAAIGAAMRNL